jgi:hypothetical protein
VRYPRDGSTSRREETSASSYPALATASPGVEPSIWRASPPALRQVGEKRACAGGSSGIEVTTLATDEARPTATQFQARFPQLVAGESPSANAFVVRRLRPRLPAKGSEARRRRRLPLPFAPPNQIREERGSIYTNPLRILPIHYRNLSCDVFIIPDLGQGI